MGDCIDCKRYPRCPNEERCCQYKYKYNRNKKLSEVSSNGLSPMVNPVGTDHNDFLKLLVDDVLVLRNENIEFKKKILELITENLNLKSQLEDLNNDQHLKVSVINIWINHNHQKKVRHH